MQQFADVHVVGEPDDPDAMVRPRLRSWAILRY